MSRFEFGLAVAMDDGQLRQRMAEDWMRGNISVSFRREPNYFAGCQVQGETFQVVKCTDKNSGKIVGLGSRLISTVFINGNPQEIGYLADLRLHADYRNSTILPRGYRFLRQLHRANPVPLYYSVILAGNQLALKNLLGGRAGLPHYRDLGLILTPAIHLDFPKPKIRIPGIRFERGRTNQLWEILQFLQNWQAKKQFSPCYRLEDFGSARLQGLNAEDFYLAIKDNQIVGTVAAWDQQGFRQTYVEQYSPQLALMRPFYNLLARLTPLKPLPEPGSKIPYFYLAFVAVAENDPDIFRGLVRAVYCDRIASPSHYFIAGLHEADPLSTVLKEYRSIEAAGRLFAVYYPEEEAFFDRLDGRIPYVEMATV